MKNFLVWEACKSRPKLVETFVLPHIKLVYLFLSLHFVCSGYPLVSISWSLMCFVSLSGGSTISYLIYYSYTKYNYHHHSLTPLSINVSFLFYAYIQKNTENKKKVVVNVLGEMSDWNKIFSSVICRPKPITYPSIKKIFILDLVVLK